MNLMEQGAPGMTQSGTHPFSSIVTGEPYDALRALIENGASPVAVGAELIAAQRKLGISQQTLARRLGKTAGVLTHYTAVARKLAPDLRPFVVKVPRFGFEGRRRSGPRFATSKLPFKIARLLASNQLGHERQVELAGPFLDGRMSSVSAEAFVVFAKGRPDLSLAELMAAFRDRWIQPPPALTPEPTPVPTPVIEPPHVPASVDLHLRMLQLAGDLRMPGIKALPEVERMWIDHAARVLASSLRPILAGELRVTRT